MMSIIGCLQQRGSSPPEFPLASFSPSIVHHLSGHITHAFTLTFFGLYIFFFFKKKILPQGGDSEATSLAYRTKSKALMKAFQ
jgi:hypothetical protein